MSDIYVMMDGEEVTSIVKDKFFNHASDYENGDLKVKQGKAPTLNFVGLMIRSDGDILLSMPKHYYSESAIISMKEFLNSTYEQDLKNLIGLLASMDNKDGGMSDLSNNFPLAAYLFVYRYRQKYGLFREEARQDKRGWRGSIHWNRTIKRVQPLLSNHQLIYPYFYLLDKQEYETFLSECMKYVLNVGAKVFSPFVKLSLESLQYSEGMFENSEWVIAQLNQCLQQVYIDHQRALIQHLIAFFAKENGMEDGLYRLRSQTFAGMWEKMVEYYLNYHFDTVKEEQLKFTTQLTTPKQFKKITFNQIDESNNNYSIELDHYLECENERYIFDAKYYHNLKELNYKQIAYAFLLKHQGDNDSFWNHDNKRTYSALILPTAENQISTELHFQLNSDCNRDYNPFMIYACYLPVKEVIESYLLYYDA